MFTFIEVRTERILICVYVSVCVYENTCVSHEFVCKFAYSM